ncbi:hypothetical protein LI328DRAFT_147330 [Trichoderma asperelloides]|nr:hypothetical protein LI328DRAFT_147330 [Trichoderma asperelloides]
MCSYIGCFCPVCEKRLQTLRVPCEKGKKGEQCGEFTEARDYVEEEPCEKCFKRSQPTLTNKAKNMARRLTGGSSSSKKSFVTKTYFQLLWRPTGGSERDYTTSSEMPSQRLLRDWLYRE